MLQNTYINEPQDKPKAIIFSTATRFLANETGRDGAYSSHC